MRPEKLEAWVLSLVDAVDKHGRVEDARVELKADWPKPIKAARRIAGHANAARSEHILWIVGLDENRGVVKIQSPPDRASWIAQVDAQFDGIAPSLVLDIVVPAGKNSVTALLFDTTRRPFVVKNPAYNKPEGGPVSLEVPWRAGTAVRSARREDLIRVLVPQTDLPSIELLAAFGSVTQNDGISSRYAPDVAEVRRAEHLSWHFSLKLYVTPPSLDPLVLPTHRASFGFSLPSEDIRLASEIHFREPTRRRSATSFTADSNTVRASQGEALLTGPGLLLAEAYHYEPVVQVSRDEPIAAELVITPARSDEPVRLGFELSPVGDSPPTPWNWELVSAQADQS